MMMRPMFRTHEAISQFMQPAESITKWTHAL